MSAFFSRRAAVGLAMTLAVAGAAPAIAATSAVPTVPTVADPKAGRVTLITGDIVQVTAAGGGRYSATVRPAPGREQISFHTTEVDGSLRVLPSDVVPFVSTGAVDADLFDVEELIAEGYGDGSRTSLPLIVTYRNADNGQAQALTGVATTRTLSSIGGTAVSADKTGLAGFWKATAPTGTASATGRTAAPALGQGIKNIWLDGRIHPTLDRSTAQIGAPTVWQGGHDGTGVKVAVLDTGIDATHPDLSRQIVEAQSFTGDPDTTDRFGHGTHVASIIAGTGAASGGTRKGVAPGASLLIGKVLDDTGSGQESWIIDAMEWAAAQHATVINMSLGGGATDGTDPMSQALNRITAETGALFVVAAGNEGADQSVGTPGAAASALTVGAVDRDDTLADFSSRGPRLGDEGLKPEITAPGVGIMAARAAGTELGPIDGQYTALSGTSMATPHVAGAAALLAQVHPGWTATRLKNALVSTAKTAPDATVFGQGAGRVDIARAAAQSVTATGTADFGLLATGTKTPLQKTITYTNDGKTAVTLALKLNVKNLITGVTGSAAITTASTVTVLAGKSVDVPLTVAPATLVRGQYSGWITATGSGGVRTTTAIGVTLDGPRHRVTFKALNRAGQPTNVPVITLFGNNPRSDYLGFLLGDQVETEVEEGDYLLQALIEDRGVKEQVSYLTNPELKITKDVVIVLDARTANPIEIRTPKPSEQQNILSYYVHRTTSSGRSISHGVMHFSTVDRVNVTPTKKPKAGTYEFSSRWQLVAPMVTAKLSGVSAPIEANLTRAAPAYTGLRRFSVVDGGKGRPADLAKVKLKGAAVIIRSSDGSDPDPGPDEYEATAAAAAAGAAVVLLVRPSGSSAWTSWSPDGEREAVPSLAVPYTDGQKLIAQAATGRAVLDLTLTTSSPYLYDVQQVSTGQVPHRIVYTVSAANSARITSRYADNGGSTWQKEQRFGWRPWQTYAWNDASRFVETPKVREEWVTAGDSVWQQQVRHDWPWGGSGALVGGITELPRSYRPGSSDTTWLGAIVRPASPRGIAELVSTRTGDTLNLRVPEFVDSAGHVDVYGASTASAVLRRDGVVVAENTDGVTDVATTAKSAAYTLALRTARNSDDWIWATKTATTWGFRSATVAGTKPKPLSLLQVDYTAPVDLTGRATSNRHSVNLTVRQQDGLSTPRGVKVTAQTSTDEGRTWRAAIVVGFGDGNGFRVVVPAGTGTVSLRVKAADSGGNTVDQTVIRAYGRR